MAQRTRRSAIQLVIQRMRSELVTLKGLNLPFVNSDGDTIPANWPEVLKYQIEFSKGLLRPKTNMEIDRLESMLGYPLGGASVDEILAQLDEVLEIPRGSKPTEIFEICFPGVREASAIGA